YGYSLTPNEISCFVNAYLKVDIADYQMSAFLMAAWFNKLSDDETFYLTQAMKNSGDIMDLSDIKGITADKHSTGGVGDKISLILSPIIACLGVKIAKMSGKGLGFTGGTIDKLESIPGFSTHLKRDEFIKNISAIGMSITSQSANLTPADKKIYALRDVTAIVDDTALIASSIMSKKLAMGADIIVLDVKCGSGGFMKEYKDAEKLASQMVAIGVNAGKKISAVITDMNAPLGRCVGNSIEVTEAVMCLKGQMPDDIKQVTYALGCQILKLSKIAADDEQAYKMMDEAITSKKAYNKFVQFITAQGGDGGYIENTAKLPLSNVIVNVLAENDGYISSIDCEKVGRAASEAGAGRIKKDDTIDYGAGIYFNKTYGEYTQKGGIIAQIYSSKKEAANTAYEILKSAITVSGANPPERKFIKGVING
ncbi:MAG: thymidine phosphorylase, partial [Eubacteriaceae bacterium]|nr:thymidine phosphorylase [Eubacteriaceae bacterium]